MQRTGEWFGVRAPIWAAASLSLLAIVISLTLRTEPQTQDTPVSKTPSSAEPHQHFAPNQSIVHAPTTNRSNSDPAFTSLLQRLSDPDPNLRLAALESLEKIELPATDRVALLTAALSDADPRIRAHAALRLGSFHVVALDAVPALKQLAQNDPDDLVRSRVKEALYNIRLYDSMWERSIRD